MISYCAMEYNNNIERRREGVAWKNHMYKDDIIKKMEMRGFSLANESLYKGETVLYKFVKA